MSTWTYHVWWVGMLEHFQQLFPYKRRNIHENDEYVGAGIYLENGPGVWVRLRPPWVQGNALVGGSRKWSPPPPRKYGFLGILKVISSLILIHIFLPKSVQEYTLRKILEKFLFLFSLRF